LALFLSQGCSTACYLYQASAGQFALFNHARPIPEVLKDERIRPRVKTLLARVDVMKKFGEANGLKATPNYREYVQLHRSAAVYVVSASDSLRFEPKTWSFPIVGSFPYLGWFDLDRAKSFAADLRKQEGWDVDVRGASAYSTLGWFRDAVLSTMIPEGEEAEGELANVILHESVHATLYVKGQSYFDESIASFIADHLTPAYLKQEKGDQSAELLSYLKSEEEGRERQKVLHDAYLDLDRLYSSNLSNEEKLSKKSEIFAALKSKLGIKRDINNATLIQYKTYNTGQTQFEELFSSCGKDWKRFLSALQSLKPESFKKPQQEDLAAVLKPLVDKGCNALP
jgi:predicted aminopeptidase